MCCCSGSCYCSSVCAFRVIASRLLHEGPPERNMDFTFPNSVLWIHHEFVKGWGIVILMMAFGLLHSSLLGSFWTCIYASFGLLIILSCLSLTLPKPDLGCVGIEPPSLICPSPATDHRHLCLPPPMVYTGSFRC